MAIRRARCEGRPTRCVLGVWIERLIPSLRFHAVEVVDDLAVFDGEFRDELLRAIDACVLHVGETVVTFFYAQHGYVGDGFQAATCTRNRLFGNLPLSHLSMSALAIM